MQLSTEDTVILLDKVEGNAAQINGHPAWVSAWDLNTNTDTVLDVQSNTFCAGGMHAPNGSYFVFGGNGAVGVGGNNDGTNPNPVYGDFDGSRGVRVFDPCDVDQAACQFFDNSTQLSIPSKRWYPGVESLPDGSVILFGGMTGGGYTNRNFPNTDPTSEGGGANPTYGFWPPRGPEQNMAFMTKTSGLNVYALAYTMPSGLVLVQANLSTSKCSLLLFPQYLTCSTTAIVFKSCSTIPLMLKSIFPTCPMALSVFTRPLVPQRCSP